MTAIDENIRKDIVFLQSCALMLINSNNRHIHMRTGGRSSVEVGEPQDYSFVEFHAFHKLCFGEVDALDRFLQEATAANASRLFTAAGLENIDASKFMKYLSMVRIISSKQGFLSVCYERKLPSGMADSYWTRICQALSKYQGAVPFEIKRWGSSAGGEIEYNVN